jgi:ectoine hydroxylase-related dioxygenase (phytanoyl-CoA dioxygenase family)
LAQEIPATSSNGNGMSNLVLTDDERESGLSGERLALALRTLSDAGYVVLENAFDAAFLSDVRATYDPLCDDHIRRQGGWDALDGKTFGERHVGFFPPLFAPLADARLAAHPAALSITHAALGEDAQCSFFHTNTCFPGSGWQPIHRDTPVLFGTQHTAPTPPTHLVINVPLVPFTLENGATEVWPGTHLIVDRDPADASKLEERAAFLPSTRTLLPLGSLVVRDLRMWHRGTPNNADHARTMLAIVYQRAWSACKHVTIPQTTWDSWPEAAKRLYRNNTVVPDAEHRAITWPELMG